MITCCKILLPSCPNVLQIDLWLAVNTFASQKKLLSDGMIKWKNYNFLITATLEDFSKVIFFYQNVFKYTLTAVKNIMESKTIVEQLIIVQQPNVKNPRFHSFMWKPQNYCLFIAIREMNCLSDHTSVSSHVTIRKLLSLLLHSHYGVLTMCSTF